MTIFSSYADYFSKLEEQHQTIKTNLANYQKRCQLIAKLYPNTPPIFSEFSDFVQTKYLPQIEADQASLGAGLRLLENAIKAIEGVINIEQTKSERNLTTMIGAVGAGLATSGVTATIASTHQTPQTYQDLRFIVSPPFILSLGIGALVGLLVWWIPRCRVFR